MHLKYIKLVILKILFILGLSNFKFSCKIPLPPPPPPAKLLPPQQYNHHHQNKASDLPLPLSKYFSKIFNPPPPKKKVQGGGGVHTMFSGGIEMEHWLKMG